MICREILATTIRPAAISASIEAGSAWGFARRVRKAFPEQSERCQEQLRYLRERAEIAKQRQDRPRMARALCKHFDNLHVMRRVVSFLF